jgi:thiol-disulfide isomerase/thioredoxin
VKKLAPLLAAVCLLLTGCSSLNGTNAQGYITGDGQVVQFQPADRGAPIVLTGTSLEGQPIDITSYAGKPLVINVWWSGCGPCRTEMPMLVKAAAHLKGKASFLGIDIRDLSREGAMAFALDKGVTYPSIYDPKGKALLAFSGDVSPRSPPTTLVLDGQQRVAAIINGEIPSQLTLTELVKQIAAEHG